MYTKKQILKKITIVGGGNIGLCLAADLSLKNANVTVLSSKAKSFDNKISVIDDENNKTYSSNKITFTNSISKAITNSDYIFCTYPAHLRKGFIESAHKFIKKNAYIGFVPAYGGAEFYCKDLIKKGVTVFGFQKPPYVSRISQKDINVVRLMSRKKVLYLSSLPKTKSSNLSSFVENYLGIKTICLKNYLNVCLLPGNPLLHTSGSYTYLLNNEKKIFNNQIYYYRKWDDRCSKLICKMSDEMMAVLKKIPLDTSGIKSIQSYYESSTPKKLTKKFHSIPSFYDLLLPMKKVKSGYVADFTSRFFTEDIPFGLVYIKSLAILTKTKTKYIDKIIDWYQKLTKKQYIVIKENKLGRDCDESSAVQNFGIQSLDDLASFYNR